VQFLTHASIHTFVLHLRGIDKSTVFDIVNNKTSSPITLPNETWMTEVSERKWRWHSW